MKKCILLLTLFTIFFVPGLYSQFTLGMRTGFNNSWRAHRNFVEKDEYVNRIGFQLSFLTYVDISKTLRIGFEPGFAERVNSATFFQFEGPTFENKVLLKYFELPLFISGRYPLWNDRLKMNVKAGYGISSTVGAVRTIETSFPGEPPFIDPFPIEQNGPINNIDHGFYSGIGIEYKIGLHKLILESVFYMGMNEILLFEPTKNRSMHFGIGYMIGF